MKGVSLHPHRAHRDVDLYAVEEELRRSGSCLVSLACECPPSESCFLPRDTAEFTIIYFTTLWKSKNKQKIIKTAGEKSNKKSQTN